jgi:hypothetical protein
MSRLKAETTIKLNEAIAQTAADLAGANASRSRLDAAYARGLKNGMQRCLTIAQERDARDAELAGIRDAVEPHKGESLTKAVKRWVYNAKNNARQLGRLRKEMAS